MFKQAKLNNFLSLVIFFILVLPFIYITKFTFPAADDWCRATRISGNFFHNIINWYFQDTGRFSNGFLSYLPVYELSVYRFVLATCMVLLGGAIYFFVKRTFRFFKISILPSQALLLTLVLYVTVIAQLPSIFEFFYWYAATTAYLVNLVFFLIFSAILFTSNFKNTSEVAGFCVLIFLSIGHHEMLIPLINYLLLVSLIWDFIKKKVFNKKLLLFNITSWISSLAVIFSPATMARQSKFSEGGDIFYSIKAAFLSSGMFIMKSLFEFPYLIFYVAVILFVYRTPFSVSTKASSINPVLLGVISFLGFVTVLFTPYYAVGHLNVNTTRIGNMIHMVFLFLIFINLINLALFTKKSF